MALVFRANSRPDYVLRRLSDTVTGGPLKFSGHRVHCHTAVALSLKARRNPQDFVVLLGWADSDIVVHSVLVDVQGRIITDTARGRLSGDTYTSAGGNELEVVSRIPASSLPPLATRS